MAEVGGHFGTRTTYKFEEEFPQTVELASGGQAVVYSAVDYDDEKMNDLYNEFYFTNKFERSVQFSPDGRYVYSCSWKCCLIVDLVCNTQKHTCFFSFF
ncbi:hypothetical protein M3Y99_01301600 [Aphelenchoides fujianensis]|nr:hypothetical protein M3Y99_01301600 [Aphelenchoides fujianensis]